MIVVDTSSLKTREEERKEAEAKKKKNKKKNKKDEVSSILCDVFMAPVFL